MLIKRTASALTTILALLLSMGAITLQVEYCIALSPEEHVYGDTVVYDIYGIGVNVTLKADPPKNKAYNSTVTYRLEIFESFSEVNPEDYFLRQRSLDFYLISGVILDYDRTRAIDTLWIYWGDSRNKTHVEEAKQLYSNIYGGFSSKSGSTYFGEAVLPELAQGVHNLTIWVEAEQDQVTTSRPLWTAFSKSLSFTIDTVAPNVTLLTPENTTYKEPEASLNFILNEPFSELAYCLDGQDNVTINGNTTLTGLPNGDHNVTIYATDEFGNTGVSETICFSVDVPFPTTLIAASVITVAVVSIGLLFIFKKRKR